MSIKSLDLLDGVPVRARASRYTVLHAGAVIAHALSYLTTLWFVQWLAPATDLRTAGAVAYGLEMLLFAFKRALKSRHGRGVGWAGVSADALINMGGLIPYAGRILSFPPVAVILALIGWIAGGVGVSLAWAGAPFVVLPYGADTIGVSLSVLLMALGGGILLSAGPAILWEAAERG